MSRATQSLAKIALAILASAIVSLGFAQAAEAGAPNPLKAIVYKRDLGPGGTSTGKTTVYNRDGLKLEASCETPYGTYIYISVTDDGGLVSYSFLKFLDSTTISKQYVNASSGETGINATSLAMGEMVYTSSTGRTYLIDAMHQKNGFGRDCSWSGLVRTVPEGKEIETGAGAGDSTRFRVGSEAWDLGCNLATTVSPRQSDPETPGMLGLNFQDPVEDEWVGRIFSPIARTVANVDSDETVMDQVLSRPDGTVTAWRARVTNAHENGCSIEGYGRAVSKGPSRAFYAAKMAPGQKKIFDSGGLELYATCQDDGGDAQVTLLARTSAKNSILKTTFFDDQGSTGLGGRGTTDFDPQRKPQQLFRLPEGVATGQIMYSRPDGRVVAMNWSMSGDDEDPKPCQFTGLASSAG